jgi:hypothetical protein
MAATKVTLTQLLGVVKFVRETRETLPEIAGAIETAGSLLRDGAAVLEQSSRILRGLAVQKTPVKVVR